MTGDVDRGRLWTQRVADALSDALQLLDEAHGVVPTERLMALQDEIRDLRQRADRLARFRPARTHDLLEDVLSETEDREPRRGNDLGLDL